jgi:predicted DNA-binding ribbon-helix-helix protein
VIVVMSYTSRVLIPLAKPRRIGLDRRAVYLISNVSSIESGNCVKGNFMAQNTAREVKDVHRCLKIQNDPFVETFNMDLAQPQSRSVRLNGLATCLRLEEVYWNILSEIARCNACSINAVLSYIDREVHLRYGGVKNFSGLIRVVCVAHLLKAEGFQLSPV